MELKTQPPPTQPSLSQRNKINIVGQTLIEDYQHNENK